MVRRKYIATGAQHPDHSNQMAPKQLIMLVVVAAAALWLPAVAFAFDHLVGGDQGWSIGVDYNKWADGNEFIVGDTLGNQPTFN